MQNNPSNFSVNPYCSSNRSGQLTGAGVSASYNNNSTSVNGGFFKSGRNTEFSVGINQSISPSTSIGIQGTVNTRGERNVSIGIERKY